MSQENVEIIRRVYEAARRGDFEAGFRDAHPEFEVTFKAGPNSGTHRGRDEIQEVFEDLLAGFDFWVMEPVELIEQDERVVAIVNNRLRPKGGIGGEFDYRNGHIWTIRNGAILSLVGFPSPEEALEAAGLRE
jgi:ketosteroid isomerase-like protein